MVLIFLTIFYVNLNSRKYLKMMIIGSISFFLIGETLFRFEYFGIQSIIRPLHYRPAVEEGLPSSLELEFRDFNPKNKTQIPISGLNANQTGVYRGREMTINDYGFRGSAYPLKKTPKDFRILILGTSIAMGAGLSIENTFPEILKTHFQDHMPNRTVQVINLSRDGFGAKDHLYIFYALGRYFNPDLILIEDTFHLKYLESEPYTFDKDGLMHMVIHSILRPEIVSFFIRAVQVEFILPLERRKGLRRLFDTIHPRQKYISVNKAYPNEVRRIIHKYKDEGINEKIYFYYLLNGRQINKRYKSKHPLAISVLVRREGLGYLDTSELHLEQGVGDLIMFPGDSHPNTTLHRAYADFMFDELTKNQPLESLSGG
jgi:hypothetical protein